MKITLTLFLSLILFSAGSQTIPASRTADWSHAGYPGNIPSPSVIVDVTTFGAVGDGVTDDANAIRLAINSLLGTRGVVYFPTGNYLIGSTLDLPDSVILRGVSNDSSKIIINFNGVVGYGINISGDNLWAFTNVVSGIERGSSALVVTDPSTFAPGDFAELVEDNGTWDTDPIFWADNSVGQILHLTQVSGDTLFFDAPLRINYDTTLNARIKKIIPAVEVGIECMEISRADNVAAGVCYNINFYYAANCWMRGVESNGSVGSHVEIDNSTNISIRGSYFHHSFLYDGVSTHGYGITLFGHSGQCLIENNIMQHLRHSFSLQTGANGNVIAYNYSFDPNRSEFPSNYGADISLHGHYPFSNLFEGNIVQNIQLDQSHGPNGPFNTFFRNRGELYGILMTSGTVQNDSMNFVGNEVTNPSPPYGNYQLFGTGHFEFGNNIKGTITPSGTTPLPDTSYYLNGYPTFWTTFDYPTVGIPNTLGAGTIPARDRFLAGTNLTSCTDDITIAVKEIDFPGLEIYPNPASKNITIHYQPGLKYCVVYLKDQNGKIVLVKTILDTNSEFVLDFSEKIADGIYLLEIVGKEKRIVKKVVAIR